MLYNKLELKYHEGGLTVQESVKYWIRAALIAALYVAITYALQATSFLPAQFRLAEALTLLPMLFPEAIWGIGVGCFIANLFSPAGLIDVVLGSLTSLLAAFITYRYRWHAIGFLSPIVLNALVVSAYLRLLAGLPYWVTAIGIAASEAVVVLGVGVPLVLYLRKWLQS
ncbi:MAG: QueT transporter family protein [Firmicutes bacterium]|nr:QueT transporter family protein [Bacillota bacterium]